MFRILGGRRPSDDKGRRTTPQRRHSYDLVVHLLKEKRDCGQITAEEYAHALSMHYKSLQDEDEGEGGPHTPTDREMHEEETGEGGGTHTHREADDIRGVDDHITPHHSTTATTGARASDDHSRSTGSEGDEFADAQTYASERHRMSVFDENSHCYDTAQCEKAIEEWEASAGSTRDLLVSVTRNGRIPPHLRLKVWSLLAGVDNVDTATVRLIPNLDLASGEGTAQRSPLQTATTAGVGVPASPATPSTRLEASVVSVASSGTSSSNGNGGGGGDERLSNPFLLPKHKKKIVKDIPRTSVTNTIKAKVDDTQDGLLYRFLASYAALDPDVGYVQGMNFVAAMIIAHCNRVSIRTRAHTNALSQSFSLPPRQTTPRKGARSASASMLATPSSPSTPTLGQRLGRELTISTSRGGSHGLESRGEGTPEIESPLSNSTVRNNSDGVVETDAHLGFRLFVRLMHFTNLRKIYDPADDMLHRVIQRIDVLVREKVPELHEHFQAEGFEAPSYAVRFTDEPHILWTPRNIMVVVCDLTTSVVHARPTACAGGMDHDALRVQRAT